MNGRISAEEADLKIHVEMCALRHEAIIRQLDCLRDAADRRLKRMEQVLWGMAALMISSIGVAASDMLPMLRLLGAP